MAFWNSRPEPPRHTLKVSVYPPELSGEGLGIVGVVLIVMSLVLATAAGVGLPLYSLSKPETPTASGQEHPPPK